jgi:hypothetical protein
VTSPDTAQPATAYQGEHRPLGAGRCEHRWRNRTTHVVHCEFAAGWAAAVAERAAIREDFVAAIMKHPTGRLVDREILELLDSREPR